MSTSAVHTTERSRPESTWNIGHWSTTDNQEKRSMSATCGPTKTTTMRPWSKHMLTSNGLNNVECRSRPRPCTLWNAHSLQAIQVRPLVHKRQSRGARHVRRMWCNTATTMWPGTKLTFVCQAQNHGRRICHPRPCTLLNTHTLKAHRR